MREDSPQLPRSPDTKTGGIDRFPAPHSSDKRVWKKALEIQNMRSVFDIVLSLAKTFTNRLSRVPYDISLDSLVSHAILAQLVLDSPTFDMGGKTSTSRRCS